MNRSLIWVAGDPWRDLTREVSEQPVTIVTRNRTARLLNLAEGWQERVPLHGGHVVAADGDRQSLAFVEFASPCGVLTWTVEGHWHVTTPVVAVLVGLDAGWATSTEAKHAQRRLVTGPSPANHPESDCPVAYCIRVLAQS
jgi:hypothetical protein